MSANLEPNVALDVINQCESFVSELECKNKELSLQLTLLTEQASQRNLEKQSFQRIIKQLKEINANLQKSLTNKHNIENENISLHQKVASLTEHVAELEKIIQITTEEHKKEILGIKRDAEESNQIQESALLDAHESEVSLLRDQIELLDKELNGLKFNLEEKERYYGQVIAEMNTNHEDQLLQLQQRQSQVAVQSNNQNIIELYKKKLQHQRQQTDKKIKELEMELSNYRFHDSSAPQRKCSAKTENCGSSGKVKKRKLFTPHNSEFEK